MNNAAVAPQRPRVDFGWNVGGFSTRGLSGQLSLVLGFNYLLLAAVGSYLISIVLRPRG